MEFIAHRINTLEQLERVPRNYGVETDLRDRDGRIILQHDPFIGGEDFERYLSIYKHGRMILNVKSEAVERRAIELLMKYNVHDYFFLDSSFPMIVALSSAGETAFALRYSEYESINTVLAMAGKAEWVWVDCFTKLPLDPRTHGMLKEAGFKICLVSPELQGQEEKIEQYGAFVAENKIQPDAICTKLHNISKWEKIMGMGRE